jgi:hypothetical protein
MVMATTIVMKNTRPKYSSAIVAATDRMVTPACDCLCTGNFGVGVGVGVRVDILNPGFFYDEMKSAETAMKISTSAPALVIFNDSR